MYDSLWSCVCLLPRSPTSVDGAAVATVGIAIFGTARCAVLPADRDAPSILYMTPTHLSSHSALYYLALSSELWSLSSVVPCLMSHLAGRCEAHFLVFLVITKSRKSINNLFVEVTLLKL